MSEWCLIKGEIAVPKTSHISLKKLATEVYEELTFDVMNQTSGINKNGIDCWQYSVYIGYCLSGDEALRAFDSLRNQLMLNNVSFDLTFEARFSWTAQSGVINHA
jgi:hypothetical protein